MEFLPIPDLLVIKQRIYVWRERSSNVFFFPSNEACNLRQYDIGPARFSHGQ